MRPRVGFGISLIAACGIHAIVLFVPRAAFVENVRIPTVELELTEVAGPPAPVATRPVAVRESARVDAPRQPEAQAPAPAAAPSGTSPPPEAPGGQAEAPVIDQPISAAPPDAGTVVVSSGAENAGTQSPAIGASGSASGARDGTTSFAATLAVPAFIPPRPLSEILPKYPLSARRSGFEGVVKVSVLVDERGAVTGIDVLSSSGHASLDQAVLDAYRQARFAPALQDGKPVAGRLVIPVRFRLAAGPN